MPIENEFKFVLGPTNPLEFFQELLADSGTSSFIRQGYLDHHARIRQKTQGEISTCTFTYKMKVQKNLIEVETKIDENDFNALWQRVGRLITKNRVVKWIDGQKWEIDFLTEVDNDITSCYLVMAELEVAPEVEAVAVPAYLQDILVYAVPQTDLRFTNIKLTKPNQVKSLVKSLSNVKR